MSVSDAWVTKNVDEWQILFELLQSHFNALCRSLGVWQVTESFRQLVHCPPHVVLFLLNLLSIQIQEWTCNRVEPSVHILNKSTL